MYYLTDLQQKGEIMLTFFLCKKRLVQFSVCSKASHRFHVNLTQFLCFSRHAVFCILKKTNIRRESNAIRIADSSKSIAVSLHIVKE